MRVVELFLTFLFQYAIQKYAVALQSAARMLAENSGFKASSCISALLAAHTNGQSNAGLNIEDGTVVDSLQVRQHLILHG